MNAAIIAIVFAIVLLVVIISAVAKKKSLNGSTYPEPDELEELEQELLEDESSVPAERDRRTRRSRAVEESAGSENQNVYSTLLYYVYLDGSKFGPFSLEQLKTYPLLEDTMITTNTLNGSWFEAKYFECLDDLFRPNLPFRIDADGTILRNG